MVRFDCAPWVHKVHKARSMPREKVHVGSGEGTDRKRRGTVGADLLQSLQEPNSGDRASTGDSGFDARKRQIARLSDEQRQEFATLVDDTVRRIESGLFLPHSGIQVSADAAEAQPQASTVCSYQDRRDPGLGTAERGRAGHSLCRAWQVSVRGAGGSVLENRETGFVRRFSDEAVPRMEKEGVLPDVHPRTPAAAGET